MYNIKNSWGRARKLLRLNQETIHANWERRAAMSVEQNWESFPERVFQTSPIFFLSTGRSGTELITRALALAKETLVHHKPTPELVYGGMLAYRMRHKTSMSEAAFLTARFDLISDAVLRDRIFIETNFRITFFAYAIQSLFPNARFIHLTRDYRAFVKSAVQLSFYQNTFTDFGRIQPLTDPEMSLWQSWSPAQKAAWFWNETHNFIDEFSKEVPRDRFLRISAEDLFEDVEFLEHIFTFCGLKKVSRRKLTKLLSSPINSKKDKKQAAANSIGSHELDQLNEWVPVARRLGYD